MALPGRQAVNLVVTIADPLREDPGIRSALEEDLSRLKVTAPTVRWKSVHTVANTIFPISLYQPHQDDAVGRFFKHTVESSRVNPGVGAWGTYIGRLVAYETADSSRVNQLERMLTLLNGERRWADLYEAPLTYPGETAAVTGDLHLIGPADRRRRGGPCLAHISLTATGDKLHLTALYRRQAYVSRAYGNFLGLARLLNFLAHESARQVGELVVIATHAEIDDVPGRSDLLNSALERCGTTRGIETSCRELGASWRDLDLPSLTSERL